MIETIRGNLYDFPRYYDLVFGSDWKAEFDFLIACFERFSKRPVKRIFEPACGTGRLFYRLAKAGYQVSGLDLNPPAVEYCNRRLRRHGLPESAYVGDMTDFRLSRKVDAAFNTINSFRLLGSETAARQHLLCISNALRKGGMYVLGLHLTPTQGPAIEEESWSARRGNLVVNSRLWLVERQWRRRRERYAMTYDVYTPTRSFRLIDEFDFRTYTAAQFERLLAQVDGLEIAGTFDFSYDLNRPHTVDPSSEDVVFVLQKI